MVFFFVLKTPVRTHCKVSERDHQSSVNSWELRLQLRATQRGFDQSCEKWPKSCFIWDVDFFYTNKHLYKNINVKQSAALHQRPDIPHFYVHGNTLGVFYLWFSCRFVPQGNNWVFIVPLFISAPWSPYKDNGKYIFFFTFCKFTSFSLTMVQSIFCAKYVCVLAGVTADCCVNSVYRPFCRWIF